MEQDEPNDSDSLSEEGESSGDEKMEESKQDKNDNEIEVKQNDQMIVDQTSETKSVGSNLQVVA